MIEISEIDRIKAEYKRLEDTLDKMGQKIYRIRTANDIGSGYGLTGWHKSEFDPDYYDSSDNTGNNPRYTDGAPILKIEYYNYRREDRIDVCVPIEYFDSTDAYLVKEQVAVTHQKEMRLEYEKQQKAEREAEERERRRNLFDQLKSEFGT